MDLPSGKLNGLDLFSGIGGFSIALEPWVRTVAYCEVERHPQSVLLERMEAGDLPLAPIWDDVRTLRSTDLPAEIDIIFGGFPCQDLSVAGSRKGLDGERSGLFFEVIRLVRDFRPRFVMLENSPNITVLGLERVLLEFDALGFDARWTVVSAEEVGAPFLGERWFLLAKARSIRHGHMDQQVTESGSKRTPFPGSDSEEMAEAACDGWREGWSELDELRSAENERYSGEMGASAVARLERAKVTRKIWRELAQHRHSSQSEWPSWLPEPALPRGHDGLSQRVERIKESGNAVVWLQAEEAFKRLIGIEIGASK